MSKASALSRARAKYVAPIEEAELAARIFEAVTGVTRPKGLTAAQALNLLHADARDGMQRAARAAMTYWAECIAAANTTN